jgi:hypothetical protein
MFNYRQVSVLLSSCGLFLIAGTMQGAPYTGSGPGTSTIRADGLGDYLSLSSAVIAINGTPLTGGNWTFLIASSTTETVKVVLGQNTNGNSITFKPAPGTTPVLTFNSAEAVNTGWGGNWIIGTTAKTSSVSPVKTDNVIIDGSNNGTSSRDLTIRNTGNANSGQLITVAGDCDGFVLKNCNMQLNTVFGAKALRFAANNQPTANLTPDNGLVENNVFVCAGPSGAGGISIDKSTPSPTTIGANNLVIRNNQFTGQIGISSTEHRNLTIERNQFNVVTNLVVGQMQALSLYNGSTTTTGAGYTTRIERNEILQVARSVESGSVHTGIEVVATTPVGAPTNTVVVTNNSVGNVNLIGNPSQHRALGINIDVPRANSLVAHNSVYITMTTSPTVTADTAGLRLQASAVDTTVTARNNLVYFNGAGGSAIQVAGTTGTVLSDGNNLHATGGAAYGVLLGTPHATRAAWTVASGLDGASTDLNPTSAGIESGGKWISASNLRFAAPVNAGLASTPVAGVTVDLDGQTRSGSTPIKGAFETTVAGAGIPEWKSFE